MISTTAVGRLTAAPELRHTPNGQPVASLTIASDNRRHEDGTTFLNITIWGTPAENASQHLTKGQLVSVSGRLEGRQWTTDNDEKRTSWELTASEIEYLTKPREKIRSGEEEPF